jgi:hypothetical protein
MPLLPAAKIKKGQQDPRIYDTVVLVGDFAADDFVIA